MGDQFAHSWFIVVVVVVVLVIAGTERTGIHMLLTMSHHAVLQSETLVADVTFKRSFSYNNRNILVNISKLVTLPHSLPLVDGILTSVGPHVAP